MTDPKSDRELLEIRVHNLELALHGLISILSDTLPAAASADLQRVAENHFRASKQAGGFSSVEFIEVSDEL